MSKVKKLVGIAAGLALFAFAPPLAGLAGGLVGTVATRLLTTVAATALMSMVGSKGMSSASGGITLSSTTAGEKTPESLILGWTATGGTLIAPAMTHGDKSSYLTHVVELCSAPGATLERLILNGSYVTLGATPHPQYGRPVLGDLEGLAWVKYYDGTQTAADPHLVSTYGADPDRPWTADMVGRGICYAILTFRFEREKLTSVPTYRFEMRGIPLYDPRRDSTAGGAGSQRWADPSTWTQTVNNAVMIYNLKRGIPLPGGEVYGGRIAAADLPAATWFGAMNECDLPVAKSGGGTEPQYRAGIEVQLSEEPAGLIEELLKACSGKVADVGGAWRIRVGGPGLPVFAMTDDDIIVTREQDFDPFPGLAQTYNAVTATYPDPESIWEPRDAPPRTSAELEAQDRFGRKTASLTISAAPYPTQVQRLMRGWIEAERRFRKHNNSLPPTACGLEPLDVIAWSSARNGYEAKLFDLDQVAEDPATCLVRIASQEVDPEDYSWHAGYELPTSIPAPGLTPPAPLVVPDWWCEGITIYDRTGAPRRPALRCTWDGEFDRAHAVKWEARLAGTVAASLRGSTQDVEAGAIIIADGILPAEQYETRGYPYLRHGQGEWSPWMPATTPAVKLGMEDLADEIEQNFREIAQRAGIPTVEGLPASGDSPDQIVFDLETHTLYRWDADAGEWVDNIYAGIPDGSLDLTKFAQGIEPVTIIEAGQPLPTVKSTSTVFWEGRLYQWSGTAYVAPDLSVADGSISAAKLADAAVVAAKLAAEAVTHASIKAGAVYGDVIAANAITARELVLTDFANMLPNPEMVDGSNAASLAGWGQISASAPATVQAGLSWQTLSRTTLILGPSALSVGIVPQGQGFGVAAGDEFWFSAVALREASAIGGNIALSVREYDAALNYLGLVEVVYNGALTNSFQTLTGSYVAGTSGNANVRYIFPIIYRKGSGANTGNVFATRPQFRRKNAANMIVDGAITTTKLAAESVAAGKLAADAVTAGTIAAGAVTAREVHADAILAKHIALIDFTNILTNGDFADGLAGWTRTYTGISVLNHGQATWPKPQCLFIPTNQSVNIAIYSGDATQPNGTKVFKVSAGDSYRLDFSYARSAPQAILYAQVGYSDNTKTKVGWSTILTIPAAGANGLLEIGATFTVPGEVPGNAGIPPAYCIIRLLAAAGGASGGYYIVDMRMRKAADASLVVDGAITANKIAAGAVTTDTLAAGAVITSKLAAGAVTAAKIAVAQLSAISADLGDITVDFAHIADLAVGRIKIADASVTTGFGVEGASTNAIADNGIASYQTVLSLAVPLDGPARVIVGAYFRGQLTNTGSLNDLYGDLRGRVTRNGVVLVGSDLQAFGYSGTSSARDVSSFVRSFSLPAGTHTYRIEAAASENSRSPVITYPSLFAFVAYK